MRAYNDIKDIVISTTHNLDMVPVEVVTDLLGGNELPGITDDRYTLCDIEHRRIQCVTHTLVPAPYSKNPVPYASQHVASILVDRIPAFYYVYVWVRNHGWVSTNMLNEALSNTFLQLLIGMKLGDITVGTVDYVTEDEYVHPLTEYCGIEIEWDRPIQKQQA